jgi:hypothetical protein
MNKTNGLLRLFAWQSARVPASLKLPLSLHIGRETGGEGPGMAGTGPPLPDLPTTEREPRPNVEPCHRFP